MTVYRGGDAIYLNVTNRCSCACEFCLRDWTDGVYGERLILDREPELDELTQAHRARVPRGASAMKSCSAGSASPRCDSTWCSRSTEWLHLRRIRSRLDTNGHGALLNPDVDVPAALAAAGLDAVTVSLNAADPESYDDICRPMFAKALQGCHPVCRTVCEARHRDDTDGRRPCRAPTWQGARRSPRPSAPASAPAAWLRRAGATTPRRGKRDDRDRGPHPAGRRRGRHPQAAALPAGEGGLPGRHRAATARRPSRPSRARASTSSSSTSCCRTWTAWRSAAASAPRASSPSSCSPPSRTSSTRCWASRSAPTTTSPRTSSACASSAAACAPSCGGRR